MLKIALVALLGSTWVFWSFIFSTRPEEVDGDTLSALVRLPASIPAQLPEALPGVFAPSAKTVERIEMGEIKVACWDMDEESEQETSLRWVRLTGKPCGAETSVTDAVSVRNLTNGYAATVFSLQARALTTDFIPLRQGKNNILIRFEQGAGVATEQQLSFYRE